MAHYTPVVPGAGVGRLESVAQRQEKINAACDSFIRIGFRPELFTIQNLHDHGYTDNDFLEYIKLLTSITDLKELASVISLGVLKFSTVPGFVSLRQFIQCVEWLKSEEGRKDMADKARRMNVEKKAKGALTPADIGLAQMLVDYAAARKRVRAGVEEEIVELKRRQRELEMESACIDADLKTKLGPLCGYEGPSVIEVRLEAYKLYVEDCRSKGLAIIPKHEMGFEKAVEAFGGMVRERHLVKYLNYPARKDIIRDYFKQKILRLEYAGDDDERKTDNFQNFVVAVSGEASRETANIVHAFAFDESVSGGKSTQPGETSHSKRARTGKQPEQSLHGGSTKI